MERVRISENVEFSKIVHGMMRLNDWKFSKSELSAFIKTILDLGITTFDHADIYGSYTCEELFGEILKSEKNLREKIEIVTKCGIKFVSPQRPEYKCHSFDNTYEHIIKSAERSLKNFGTNYIDLFLIHRPSMIMNPDEVARALTELKKSGKIKEAGVSNYTPSYFDLLQSRLEFKLANNQIEISPLALHHFYDGTINHMSQHKIPMMIWSPLAGGRIFTSKDEKAKNILKYLEIIAQKYNASIDTIIYSWILHHPSDLLPVCGSGNINRIKAAADAIKIKITSEEWFEIYTRGLGRDID